MQLYLDHNATTPPLPDAVLAMEPWLRAAANPSSAHRFGQAASAAIESARRHVADLIGFQPHEVIFTSSATESSHLYFHGLLQSADTGTIVTSAIEHPSVLGAATWMSMRHRHMTLPVSSSGVTILTQGVPADTRLISLMAANHETGVVQPISEAVQRATEIGIPLHVDATQAIGKMETCLEGVSAVTLSAHKFGGCQGVGVLAVRGGTGFPPLFHGGGQERGRRAGTSFVAGIVAAGVASIQAKEALLERRTRWLTLRDQLETGLSALGANIVGADVERLPNTTLATFAGLNGPTLVTALDIQGLCVSAGAACASGSVKESAVLTAMANPDAACAVRVSMGRDTSEAEIASALAVFERVVATARRVR
jgi:cysteine desulfurase